MSRDVILILLFDVTDASILVSPPRAPLQVVTDANGANVNATSSNTSSSESPSSSSRSSSNGTTPSSTVVGPSQRHEPARLALRAPHCEAGSLYGKALVQVGGPVEGAPSVDEDPGPRGKDIVPWSWQLLPAEFYEELIHCYNGIGIIGLTSSGTTCPMVAIKQRRT